MGNIFPRSGSVEQRNYCDDEDCCTFYIISLVYRFSLASVLARIAMARRLFEANRFSNRFRYFQASIANLRYSSSAAKIFINSREPGTTFLTDEELSITITGLRPKQNITLRAISHSGGKHSTLFQSFAHYQADRDGLVDLKKHESIGGSYQGTEAMGLFWSMTPLKNDTVTVTKLADSDAHMPLKSELELYDGFIDLRFNSYSDALSFLKNISPMESKTIERWYYRKEKTRSETVKHGRIRGEIFIPNGPGEFQGGFHFSNEYIIANI